MNKRYAPDPEEKRRPLDVSHAELVLRIRALEDGLTDLARRFGLHVDEPLASDDEIVEGFLKTIEAGGPAGV